MYQDIEGQKPVIITRNHNARVRPPVYRWTAPADWSPAWNMQRAEVTGLFYGVASAIYNQIYHPSRELMTFYQAPDSISTLRIFTRELVKMENFRSGFASNLMFSGLFGLAYQAPRFYLWRDLAGGYPVDSHFVDLGWLKKWLTSMAIGATVCWIPVPFYNLSIRYEQDKILPKELSRGYKNHFHAAYVILKKDGIFPFWRSSGPLMAEAFLETFALFYWVDFIKEKTRHFKSWGTDQPGSTDWFHRIFYVSGGVYFSLMTGYPLRALRFYVDELPKNAQGELFFKSYAEALWKSLGDHFNIAHLWNNFHKHVGRAGLPLFLTTWFADCIGLFDQLELPSIYVPSD